MQNGQRTNTRTHRPRPAAPIAARSRQWTPNGVRPESTGSQSAQRNYERYLALAREAALKGDTIEMQNCYQHAEHYFRVMKERQGN